MLADDDGIFGSSMSDSTRAMVTENAEDILVVIYCFENNIDLDVLLSKARNAFERFAAAENIDSWIYINACLELLDYLKRRYPDEDFDCEPSPRFLKRLNWLIRKERRRLKCERIKEGWKKLLRRNASADV